ncbi:MAG TPA: hypothetical protein VHC18_20745 [Amycolatopsis sp.]|nr:hypothetical protein [Amycolatopsis sp.]
MSYRRPRSMIPLAAAGIAVVAASTGCNYVPGPDRAEAYAPAPNPQNMMGSAPGLMSVRVFDLGQLVVDSDGYTLYRSDADGSNPPRSACDQACTQTWKPVTGNAAARLDGLDPKLAGTFTRADGTDQATLGGWPLYRYSKDEMPGETAGTGVAGWAAITPQGKKVGAGADPGRSDAFGL